MPARKYHAIEFGIIAVMIATAAVLANIMIGG